MKLRIAALALLCAACTDPATEREWHGVARRSCGPADGPAIEIALDTVPYAACTTSHSGEARVYTDAWSYDSLRTGNVLELSGGNLCPGNCGAYAWDYFRLEIVSRDSAFIVGRFQAETRKAGAVPAKTVTGTVQLKTCPDRPFPGFCG